MHWTQLDSLQLLESDSRSCNEDSVDLEEVRRRRPELKIAQVDEVEEEEDDDDDIEA